MDRKCINCEWFEDSLKGYGFCHYFPSFTVYPDDSSSTMPRDGWCSKFLVKQVIEESKIEEKKRGRPSAVNKI